MAFRAREGAVGTIVDVERVVKDRSAPCVRVVAGLATCGEAGGSVIGIGGSVVIGKVARGTARGHPRMFESRSRPG
jgi:hypothetical protein